MFLYQQQKGSLTGKVSRTSAVVHFQCAALIRRMHSIESIGNDSWLCASLTSTKQYLGNRGDYLGSSRTPNRSTVDGFLRISLRKGTWWRHLSCNGDMPCTASNAFSGDVQVCRLQLGLFENDRHSWATWTRKFWSACLSLNSTIAARPKKWLWFYLLRCKWTAAVAHTCPHYSAQGKPRGIFEAKYEYIIESTSLSLIRIHLGLWMKKTTGKNYAKEMRDRNKDKNKRHWLELFKEQKRKIKKKTRAVRTDGTWSVRKPEN